MVTAEAAMVLPVLVLVMLAGVLAISVAQARVSCADAAREAARAVARGDLASAERLADEAAGRAVQVTRTDTGSAITRVRVQMRLRPVPWWGSITITDTAVAATEPSAPP